MSKVLEYMIEGELKSDVSLDLAKAHLAVRAYVHGQPVACAPVDESGHYTLKFKHDRDPQDTEVRVESADLGDVPAPALSRQVPLTRYMSVNGFRSAHLDFPLSEEYVKGMTIIARKYHIHGTVYSGHYKGSTLVSFDPVTYLKVEYWLVNEKIRERAKLLGAAYTGPDGHYDFYFKSPVNLLPLFRLGNTMPDVKARIYQFSGSVWKQVYSAPVDWDISQDFQRDFIVPETDLIPSPPPGVKPATGFKFVSLGLLPVDSSRIVDGYFYAQSNDPARIAAINCQPFCGQMRVFGLFGTPPDTGATGVTSYLVEWRDALAPAPASWTAVMDSLENRKWNPLTHTWDAELLGPDAVSHLYTNIDTEPEIDWQEHALKFEWDTTKVPNGKYIVRITGYYSVGAVTKALPPVEMPAVWVENGAPLAEIEAIAPAVMKCGALALQPAPDRSITFRIRAEETDGHILYYKVWGTRGKAAQYVGDQAVNRPDPLWDGVDNATDVFPIPDLSGDLIGCTAVAYNFTLEVQGLATDCYDTSPLSQRNWGLTNLIVYEPGIAPAP